MTSNTKRYITWCGVAFLLFLGLPHVVHASKARQLRLALLIGNNSAGGRAPTLKYAEADAQKMRDILVQMSHFSKQHIWLQLGQSSTALVRTFAAIKRTIQAQKARHKGDVMLLLYYSGHVRKETLLMGKSSVSFVQLSKWFRGTGATLRLGIFDACESGGLTRIKGLRRTKKGFRVPFLHATTSTKGEVILTATGAQENAHEDQDLKGGIFTHFLASGLRGAADRDKDGFVTLEEAYQYVYTRSLRRTMLSSHGPQRARFLKKLSGRGKLVLASLKGEQARLFVPGTVAGRFFVWNKDETALMAEFEKQKGQSIVLALPPGTYRVQWRMGRTAFVAPITLQPGKQVALQPRHKSTIAWKPTRIKGKAAVVSQKDTRMMLHETPFGLIVEREGKSFNFSHMAFANVNEAFKRVDKAKKLAKMAQGMQIAGFVTLGVGVATAATATGFLLATPPNENTSYSSFAITFGLSGAGIALLSLLFFSQSNAILHRSIRTYNQHRTAKTNLARSVPPPLHQPTRNTMLSLGL